MVSTSIIAIEWLQLLHLQVLINKADEFNNAFNKMAAQTGMSTEELEKFKSKRDYAMGLGEDIL